MEICTGVLSSPPILLLDELTANLDDDTIWDIMHLLAELNNHGTTIIMATHASQYVNIMRRRVVTLVDGKLFGDVKNGKYGDIHSATSGRPTSPSAFSAAARLLRCKPLARAATIRFSITVRFRISREIWLTIPKVRASLDFQGPKYRAMFTSSTKTAPSSGEISPPISLSMVLFGAA